MAHCGMLLLHATATATATAIPRSVLETSRDYTEDEWDLLAADLADRGLLDHSGAITPAGRALKSEVETTTDRLEAPASVDSGLGSAHGFQ